MKHNVIISVGSFNAALAIALGAFAAHGLEQRLDARSIEIFNTAADFHFWHAAGLILVGLIAKNSTQSSYVWYCLADVHRHFTILRQSLYSKC